MTDFRAAATGFADALMAYGLDHYGPVHTPMFCHFIDLETLEIPVQRNAAEWRALMSDWEEDNGYLMWGKDRSNLTWAHQSNLLWDTEAIRLFFRLSATTGNEKYASTAESYMEYFLAHCVNTQTGLFAWGEHAAYDVLSDRVEGQRHELQHPNPLWEELWCISPEKVKGEIEALYRYHIVDKDAMIYDRHARFWDGLPERDQATIIGYAGVFAKAWAFLWKKTGDNKNLDWARRLFRAFQCKADAAGLYPDNWSDADKRGLPRTFPPRPALAEAMFEIGEMTGAPEWTDDACRYLAACLGDASGDTGNGGEQGKRAFGGDLTAGISALEAAFKATGDRAWLETAVNHASDLVAAPIPNPSMAGQMAERIDVLRKLHALTGDFVWRQHAEREAEYAVRAFVHESGLIRGTASVRRRDYYDAIQGSGKLALAFLLFAEHIERRGVVRAGIPLSIPLPPAVPPTIEVISSPTKAPNHEPISVAAVITHPNGVGRKVLHYAVGYRVGFTDQNPHREGSICRFEIPGPAPFEGRISFAIEALSAGGSPSRAVTPWHTVFVGAAEEHLADSRGEAQSESIGIRAAGFVPGDKIRFETEDAAAHAAPGHFSEWTPAGLFFMVEAPLRPAAFLSASYLSKHAERFQGETLRLAWRDPDSNDWVVPEGQKIDTVKRMITCPFVSGGVWAIVGRSRIRWQANQREANPTICDLDGDGAQQVALTQYANGELLNSDGTTRFVLRLGTSSRPVQNTSSPLAADLDGDGRPELVIGATSGHVHAFRSDGEEIWQAAVGGEVRGGIAGVFSEGMGEWRIAVAWHDAGVAVLDSDGSVRWQRELASPADCTPVICAPPGRPPLVITADAEGLSAFRLEDGTLAWRYRVEAGPAVAPAIGQIERGGDLCIATGDGSGTIHLLSREGELRERWTLPARHAAYRPVIEVGMAPLAAPESRQIVVTTAGGLVWACQADGTPVWQFMSREQETGFALGVGGRLAFADLTGSGLYNVVVAEQDQYVYALKPDGAILWEFRGAFFYHYSPVIADLHGQGELTVITTSPCPNGTYALRAGFRRTAGPVAPWPTMRGDFARTNCAPWLD